MIRVGKTRNLLRASSSPLEIWTRSAHHHPGQRRHVSRTNRPDKSTHSITSPEDQNFLANRAASTKEGWTSDPSPPPLAPAKAFSRSGCGRIFLLFSRVMRDGLSTGPCAGGHGSGLSGPILSGPHDCADLVNSFQGAGIATFFRGLPEHFDAGGVRHDGPDVEPMIVGKLVDLVGNPDD